MSITIGCRTEREGDGSDPAPDPCELGRLLHKRAGFFDEKDLTQSEKRLRFFRWRNRSYDFFGGTTASISRA